MNKFPYFEVDQKSTKFILTKMTADYLLERVDFEFRFPYTNSEKDVLNADRYIEKLKNKTDNNIKIEEKADGIQRRTDLGRIESIADHIYNNKSNTPLFPTPLVLGVIYILKMRRVIIMLLRLMINIWRLSFPKIKQAFTIIDGQHRMLGIARYRTKYDDHISNIELPIILIPEVNLQDATKIFIDINANQRKVNRSIVYDLYANIDDREYEYIKSIKTVVQALNENKSSVLNNQIKMLGTGQGSISLAFMIEYIDKEIIKGDKSFDQVKLLKNLNSYFSAFKFVYPKLWQTLFIKTTGMGALLMYYLIAVQFFGEFINVDNQNSFKQYLTTLNLEEELLNITGTGKKAQKYVLGIINKSVPKFEI
uniref:DGQHR domain-containing protein n=1 Tax=Lactococcus lactis subsp. lactis bv. diacetylactis TaxID=44688 RepID=G1FE30_LACLL|nr:DGQHR domain-containing protein [Lactococcus lactis]AEK97249.1 hypothetical protein PVF_pVF21p05 [Lactococcus lactis subsp. lactis bv. diacetylactis]